MRARLLIVLVGVIAGCVHYTPTPLDPADAAHQLETRTLSDDGLRTFFDSTAPEMARHWPRESWDVVGLTLAALYFQPSLKVARAEWAAAGADIRTASARPNPALTAGPGYNVNASGFTPWLPFATLEWPIETAGKRRYRVAKAEHLSDAARLQIHTTAWQIQSHVRSALVDCIAAAKRQALLRQQVALQERAIELLEQRGATGAISTAEIAPARLALQRLRLDESAARSQRSEARVRLAEAVAVPVSALDDVALTFDLSAIPADVSRLTARDARYQALVGRPDILAGLSDYAASQAALQLEIAKQYPDLRLSPGYQLDDGENKWTIGVSVELPIFNRNQGPIAEADARRALAAAHFEALQAAVIAEVDRAVALYSTAADIVAQAREVVAVQQQHFRSVHDQYQAGAVDRLELLNAQLDLGGSQVVLVISETRLQQAVGALVDAVQQPWDFEQLARTTSQTDEHRPARWPEP